MPSAAEIASRLRARQRLAKMAFIAGVVIVFGVLLGARPARNWWRANRAAKNLSSVQEAMAAQNWTKAAELVGQALQDAPSDPKVLRAVAEIQSATGESPQNIVLTLQRLVALKQAEPEDYLALAKAHLDRGDLPAVQVALSAVPASALNTPLALEVETEWLLCLGRVPEAEAKLREAMAARPDDTDCALRLAAIDLQKSDPELQGSARGTLWQFARSKSQQAPLAMNLLLQDTKLSPQGAKEMVELARAHDSPAGISLRYSSLGAVLRLIPDERAVTLDEETARSSKSLPDTQLAFLRFLAAVQEPQRLLEYLAQHGDELSQRHPGEILNLRLEALAQSHQWPQVRAFLASIEAKSLDVVSVHLWNACASAALDPHERGAREHLRAAFAVPFLSSAARVADTADRLGYADLAADFYEKLALKATLPGDRVAFLEKAFEASGKLRQTAAMRRIADQIAASTPGHLGNAFRADYLALLTGTAPEPVVMRLSSSSEPADLETRARHRLLWAMIYRQRNQIEPLRAEIAELETMIGWPPGQRAVLAGLIGASGDNRRAFELAERIPPQPLLPEEADILRKVR